MALPTFTVGQVLTAADVNQYLKNTIVARKTATESVTSSTTMQDDDHLTVSVEANATYELTCMLRFDGDSTTGDIKYMFVGPAGATLAAVVNQVRLTGLASTDDQVTSASMSVELPAGCLGAGNTVHTFIQGIVVVSSTAGTFKLQWAQNGSSATATRMFADSYVCLRQIL